MQALRRTAPASPVTDLFVALAVAAAYVAAAKLGLALAFQAAQVSAVWPPSGLALAAVWRLGPRAVPGVLLGAFFANATAQEPLLVAAGVALGNTLEVLAAAALLRRAAFDPRLARVRDVLALLAAAAASPVLSATIGVASLGAGGVQPIPALPHLWRIWWVGDALGILVVAPLLLTWSGGYVRRVRRRPLAEGAVLIAALAGATMLVFGQAPPGPVAEYVVFPFLIWAALRFGPAGTAAVTAVAYAAAVWGTVHGRGPFAGGAEGGLLLLEVFMAVAATTGLLLGAVSAQQRRGEKMLRRQAELLADADRRKDEFLATLAHELRNPLAPILHAAEILGRSAPSAPNEQARRVIQRQGEHLARVVDDLLDVSRITRDTVRLERRRMTLGEAVATAVETCRPRLEARRHDLVIDLPAEPLWLDADPVRLAQILANLLHNATKFTPDGGRIALTATAAGGEVTVAIRDTGIGMTPEVLASAFELFAQGPPPLDRPHGGLGLGLTLVRRLVELHGGTVAAASDGPGRGSELVVRLPAAEPPAELSAASGEPVAEPAAAARPRRRVLVVDDNVDACDSMAVLLRLDGHEVGTAYDGPGALAAAERLRPEVLLLDLGLPGLDGYAVARALRAEPTFDDLRIVAISGYGQPEDRERSRAAGIEEHLLKPVEPQRLRELVR